MWSAMWTKVWISIQKANIMSVFKQLLIQLLPKIQVEYWFNFVKLSPTQKICISQFKSIASLHVLEYRQLNWVSWHDNDKRSLPNWDKSLNSHCIFIAYTPFSHLRLPRVYAKINDLNVYKTRLTRVIQVIFCYFLLILHALRVFKKFYFNCSDCFQKL